MSDASTGMAEHAKRTLLHLAIEQRVSAACDTFGVKPKVYRAIMAAIRAGIADAYERDGGNE